MRELTAALGFYSSGNSGVVCCIQVASLLNGTGRVAGDQRRVNRLGNLLEELGPCKPENIRFQIGNIIAMVKYLKNYHTEGGTPKVMKTNRKLGGVSILLS